MLMFKMLKQKTEEQFAAEFIQSGFVNCLSDNPQFYISELETLHGRPDLVVFDTLPGMDISVKRAIINSPSTKAFAAVVLAFKSLSKPLAISDIVRSTGMTEEYIRNVVRSLKREGLLLVLESGKFELHKKVDIPETIVISVEFKLHDWRKAIRQSLRHKAFADNAYVIMPYSKKNILLKNKHVFKEFGVSLAVFDNVTKKFEVIVQINQKNFSELSYLDVVSRICINQSFVNSAPQMI